MEPTVVSVSRGFYTRSELVKLARPHPNTVSRAAQTVWKVCVATRQPVNVYTLALVYVQKCLLLNPPLLAKLESEDQEQLLVFVTGCVLTALLTEGQPKKLEEFTRVLNIPVKSVPGIQRIVLETVCFDLRHQSAVVMVIRIGKLLVLPRKPNSREKRTPNLQKTALATIDMATIKLAYLIAIDAYETTAVVQFPAHHVAAACIEIGHFIQTRQQSYPWDLEQMSLSRYAINTTIRLLLDLYVRSAGRKTQTHAPIEVFARPDIRSWLDRLRTSAPRIDDVEAPSLRDADVSSNGVARYFVDA